MSFILELLATAALFVIVAFIICIAVVGFALFMQWKIYIKMGAPGWSAIIPFYSTWVLCEKIWVSPLISLSIIIPQVLLINTKLLLGIFLFIIIIVMSTITNWKKYKCFGKSTGFCVLGIFLPIITDAIIAFGNAEYINAIQAKHKDTTIR